MSTIKMSGTPKTYKVLKQLQADRLAKKAFNRFLETGNVAAHYSRVLTVEKATRTVLGHLTA